MDPLRKLCVGSPVYRLGNTVMPEGAQRARDPAIAGPGHHGVI